MIVQCADSGVEPAEETSREYERLVALKYLDQSGQKRRIFYKLLSCQSGVDRSAIMTFKKSKEHHKDAHFAKADKNNPRSAEQEHEDRTADRLTVAREDGPFTLSELVDQFTVSVNR